MVERFGKNTVILKNILIQKNILKIFNFLLKRNFSTKERMKMGIGIWNPMRFYLDTEYEMKIY